MAEKKFMPYVRRLFIEVHGTSEEKCLEYLNDIYLYANHLFHKRKELMAVGTYKLEYWESRQWQEEKQREITLKKVDESNGFISYELGRQYKSNLDAILDMLHHYWYVKGILTNEIMAKALRLLKREHNPFIDGSIVNPMKAMAIRKGYDLAHEVFNIKLKNDK